MFTGQRHKQNKIDICEWETVCIVACKCWSDFSSDRTYTLLWMQQTDKSQRGWKRESLSSEGISKDGLISMVSRTARKGISRCGNAMLAGGISISAGDSYGNQLSKHTRDSRLKKVFSPTLQNVLPAIFSWKVFVILHPEFLMIKTKTWSKRFSHYCFLDTMEVLQKCSTD